MLYIKLECNFLARYGPESLSASKGCILYECPRQGSRPPFLWALSRSVSKPLGVSTPELVNCSTPSFVHTTQTTALDRRSRAFAAIERPPNLGSGPLNQAANASWSRQHPVGPKHTFLWPRQVLCMRCNHHRHNPTVQRAGSLNGILFLANAVTSVAGPPDAWIQDYEGAKQSASEILTLIQVKRQRESVPLAMAHCACVAALGSGRFCLAVLLWTKRLHNNNANAYVTEANWRACDRNHIQARGGDWE